jgi:hypothetical protein
MLARPAGDKNAMLARPGVADPGGSGWGTQIGCGLRLLRIEKTGLCAARKWLYFVL